VPTYTCKVLIVLSGGGLAEGSTDVGVGIDPQGVR